MSLLFSPPENVAALYPLTWTRAVDDIRIGILTIREKWEKSAAVLQHSSSEFRVSSAVCPTPGLIAEIAALQPGQALTVSGEWVASNGSGPDELLVASKESPVIIRRPFDIFRNNEAELRRDFDLLTGGRRSQPLPASNTLIGDGGLFIEEGARLEACIINTRTGPVYIGAGAEMMEGCMIRGPFALGEHAVLKMGAKIYGATTIGPGCKVGGEVNNSVFFANSNKAHDGFIGNSVIGEWCNLGADTNCSNLKNTYGEVDVYNYTTRRYEGSGLQFCGLVMGDHAKCGINTMFNTGTVVGVAANVFGSGFPPKFIPDFAWGGAEGFATYDLEKAFETIERVWERRGKKLPAADREMLKSVYAQTQAFRHWE